MIIYAKIGSMPARYVRVFRKRKSPEVGDFFKVHEHLRSNGTPEPGYKLSGVHCLQIGMLPSGERLYVLERF